MSARLATVLDLIIPAAGENAGAGALDLATRIEARVGEPILAALPSDFESRGRADQIAALQALERDAADAFAAFVGAVYTAYYTDPRVLDAIEAASGYPARPPQPKGYEMEPFDASALDGVRLRAKRYRKP